MQTRIVSLDSNAPSPSVLRDVVSVLKLGELVAFPTETVYGLGARLFDNAAVARVFEAKGRPANHPLIAHVMREDDALKLASEWTERASRLARAFWPGPLTLVVKRAAHIAAIAAGGGDSIAIRAPAHPIARGIIDALGEPIVAPSANRYQSLSPTTAQHVLKSLGGRIALIVDGGNCSAGIESTVVDVRGEIPRILRPGAVGVAALRAIEPLLALPSVEEKVATESERSSPGMDARHYAPRARLVIANGRAHALEIIDSVDRTLQCAIVSTNPAAPAIEVFEILPADPEGYASQLFATLHSLDERGMDVIVVEAVPNEDAWCAVADRLRRASTLST